MNQDEREAAAEWKRLDYNFGYSAGFAGHDVGVGSAEYYQGHNDGSAARQEERDRLQEMEEADTLANMVDSDWACQELPEDYRF